ncbi:MULTISPECIES: head maturation protease, ClpP-related [Leuconostoc]|uniref:ATP-dependent Clp protease proteolytic subunit n=1 Tax=Leuconostoc mesenteroides subsp. cremoris ATCC 19254 TaxID=586220 RepID=C2KJ97_LEUMC|nr:MULTISPECIES: head maturation protease, ClpP-related [Leuconostoc]KDA48656.1 Prophage Clp protease-like protein [Leuconostoc pseudomesenteroides 1159]KDA50960.1 Prophage Clp protease-like protein [Leuconostoc mesenteroides subsp. cremoris T26]OQJ73190.1 Clp protease ClpP [Leuconostoc pseudomesenteroides]EEJ42634.1 endopeptidase Clp [Leuconostoc mesenteroides subsp. cremoris ATCC 19254]MDG9745653.1 Clp protease ClpP [Leuconostoc falkenbergense]
MTNYFQMKATNNVAQIDIFGDIVSEKWFDEETSATSFRDALKELGDVSTINLSINSGGGSVFDGIAIYNMLKSHKATVNVYIEGLAASIASVIAMAGDTITMRSGSMIMVHMPWTLSQGNAEEMRKTADTLEKTGDSIVDIYSERTGISSDDIRNIMNDETWLSAEEAVEQGWATKLDKKEAVMNSVPKEILGRFSNVPKNVLARVEKKTLSQDRLDLIEREKQTLKLLKDEIGE